MQNAQKIKKEKNKNITIDPCNNTIRYFNKINHKKQKYTYHQLFIVVKWEDFDSKREHFSRREFGGLEFDLLLKKTVPLEVKKFSPLRVR